MAQHNSTEKRKLKRFIIRVQVLDSESKSFFAYTENLHMEGMMLTSEKEIPVGKEFHLELVHIRDNDERITKPLVTIPLHMRCVWNRPSDSHTSMSFLMIGRRSRHPVRMPCWIGILR